MYVYYFMLLCVCYSAADREDARQTFVQFKNSLQQNFHVIKVRQHVQNSLRNFFLLLEA